MAIPTANESIIFPPPWYILQKSPANTPYIALPLSHPAATPIFITPLSPDDVQAMAEILNIPSINHQLISPPTPYTASDASHWINTLSEASHVLPLQVIRAHHPISGPFIGSVTLAPVSAFMQEKFSFAQSEYNLGYFLHPDWQGKGIMRNAVLALLAYGEQEFGVRNIVVGADQRNAKSWAVVRSLGDLFGPSVGSVEVAWPESKGGGVKVVGSCRWTSKLI